MNKIDTTQTKEVKGILKLFFKAPVYLYRWGLGFLLGKRFIYFTHIGHKSGKTRDSVIEVIYRDKEADLYYAVAAYGSKAHWLQNIRKNGQVQAQTGTRKFSATAAELNQADGFRMLSQYAEKHPRLFKELMKLVGYQIEGTPKEIEALAQLMPVVIFTPKS